MADIRPFKIAIPDSELDKLRQKLALARFPDELEDAGWDYGTPLDDVKRIAAYWKDKYDWRAAEQKLNELPQFETTVDVDGFGPLDIHFIYQKSSNPAAIPLLFVHGWPGSYIEVTKLLPLLKDGASQDGQSYHVIAPSLPNFGFSSGVKKRGFDLKKYAETFHKLMLALGYDQYVTQGGDWGSPITRNMGRLYPSSVKASHLNFIPMGPPTVWEPLAFLKMIFNFTFKRYSAKEMEALKQAQEVQAKGMGYLAIQSTKPQTIGYALAESPVALLAWIYEKLHDWTDSYPWTEEEVITWVSIYWFSRAGPAASTRIYYEGTKQVMGDRAYVPKVKYGFAYFPKEVAKLPKDWARTTGEVVYEVEHESGGHFAAFEKPEAIAGDLRIMFSKGGPAYGVVDGRNGYAS